MHQFDKVEMVQIVRPEDSGGCVGRDDRPRGKVPSYWDRRTVKSFCALAIWAFGGKNL